MSGIARSGEPVPAAVEADYESCLSCNACRSVCTMHVATNRLPPLKLLRMAALGMVEPLLASVELWYCLQCNQCTATCPMSVKPSLLIRRLRSEALGRGLVSDETLVRFEQLEASFQRVRWHMIAQRAEGARLAQMADDWRRWSETPIEPLAEALPLSRSGAEPPDDELEACLGFSADFAACMTCGACTTACPVTHDRAVYDPVTFFRMVNLGAKEELLRSPSLWLCLGCQACTNACSQQVAGHLVMRGLQDLSQSRGLVPADVRAWLWSIDHALLPRYLQEVDVLFQTG